jgi:hypothetical protein
MGSTGWRVLRAVAGVLVVALAIRTLAGQWEEIRAQGIVWQLDWVWIGASLLLTWAMYLLLVGGWRALIVAWGERLPYWTGVRIWLLASLGKYVPGKVWALVGMGVLAQRAGVNGGVAVGSSVVMQLLALATGGAVAAGFLGATVLDDVLPGGALAAHALAAICLAGSLVVTSPALMGWIGSRTGQPGSVRAIRPAQLLIAGLPNLIAWLGYGLALVWLLRGTLGGVELDWVRATGAFTASYLAGYLFLLAPGGLGVREGILVLLLQDSIGPGNAVALAATSRLALTVNELGVALPLLFLGRSSRDDT